MDWRQTGKEHFRRGVLPLGRGLQRRGVTANQLTIAGAVLSLLSGGALFGCHRGLGLLFLLLGGCCDFLDGAVARAGGTANRFGAFLDSTLDRYAEMFVYVGLLGCFLRQGLEGASVGVMLALGGSFLVSYTRARAESLGFSCSGGFAQRPERIVILAIGLALGPRVLIWAVWFIAVISHVTALQRMLAVRKANPEGDG